MTARRKAIVRFFYVVSAMLWLFAFSAPAPWGMVFVLPAVLTVFVGGVLAWVGIVRDAAVDIVARGQRRD